MTLLPNGREQESILFPSRDKSHVSEVPFSILNIANKFLKQMWYILLLLLL